MNNTVTNPLGLIEKQSFSFPNAAAEQVYHNIDLIRIILSYNKCTHCHLVGYLDEKRNQKTFFKNFYNIFYLSQYKPLLSVCSVCVNWIQGENNVIIKRHNPSDKNLKNIKDLDNNKRLFLL